jgi:hypothetical protein
MLQHLSPKFELPPANREPRAALILNRFTRSLSIMFSTNAIASILGLTPQDIQNKSFYECIQESCLEDAVRCLESAKANDSIAYLRFWSRDPRREEDIEELEESDDDSELDGRQDGAEADGPGIKEEGSAGDARTHAGPSQYRSHDSFASDSDSGGGVRLDDEMDLDSNSQPSPRIKVEDEADGIAEMPPRPSNTATTLNESSSSANSMQSGVPLTNGETSRHAPFARPRSSRRRPRYPLPSIELEAVVSCTSDGLVVILRKARPPIPTVNPQPVSSTPRQGVFAAPWGQQPIQPQYAPEAYHSFQAPFAPSSMPLRAGVAEAGGPPASQLMDSIREIAVFAWAVVGINGNLASYSRGRPLDRAQPNAGFPIWDPSAGITSYQGPINQAVSRWAAFENDQPGWPPHNNFGPGMAPGPPDFGHGSRFSGTTLNGLGSQRGSQHSSSQHGNQMWDGHGSQLPGAHENSMPKGSIGHEQSANGPMANGHNTHTPDENNNYIFGPSTWSYPSQMSTQAGNSYGHRGDWGGQYNGQIPGHGRDQRSGEATRNMFSGAPHDSIADGQPSPRDGEWPGSRRPPQ